MSRQYSGEPSVIVCEKSGRWAVALQRLWSFAEFPLRQTRSWPECRRELVASPASAVLLEAAAESTDTICRQLIVMHQRFPQAVAVVATDADGQLSTWLFREAGAVDVVSSLPRLATTAQLLERHLQSLPQPTLSLRDAIWNRLPWRAVHRPSMPQD
jgi:hypothetical protein